MECDRVLGLKLKVFKGKTKLPEMPGRMGLSFLIRIPPPEGYLRTVGQLVERRRPHFPVGKPSA
jgi:hypothetical protein